MKAQRLAAATAPRTLKRRSAAAGKPTAAQHPRIRSIIRPARAETGLAVGSPNSQQEKKADRVAAALTGGTKKQGGTEVQNSALRSSQPSAPQSDRNTTPVGPALARQMRRLDGGGKPLETQERNLFEHRLQQDLGHVRIHHDKRAARLADSIDAKAFTLGNHIVFGGGEYRPGTPGGKHLLAHELAHVMQQNATAAGAPVIQRQCADRLGTCDYYDCREEHNPCGADGYYLGYGGKYCDRFNNQTKPKLSSAGQAWVDSTTRCLQRYLENHVPYDADCDDVRRWAFDSHPDCYVQGGICDLPVGDWWEIFWTVDASDMEVRQALLTAFSCPGEWWEDVERTVGYYLSVDSLPDWMRAFGVPYL